MNAITVRVIQDNGELSKMAYTYTIDSTIDLTNVEEVYVPMRGKPVKCLLEEIFFKEAANEYLDTLPYPKDKVVHLGKIKRTVELSVEEDDVDNGDVNDAFKKFLK